MKPLEFPLLADENVHGLVVNSLREAGRNVVAVRERGLSGAEDDAVIRLAEREGRVILTHDRDFGGLAVQSTRSKVGIIYLRPGHRDPSVILDMLAVLDRAVGDVDLPFILVVDRRVDSVRIRLRKPE